MKFKLFAASVLLMAALGCGKADVDEKSAEELSAGVAQIRQAAAAQNIAAARSLLASFRSRVAELQSSGQITKEKSLVILEAAARVEENLALAQPTPQPTPTVPVEDEGNGERGKDGEDGKPGGKGGKGGNAD